MSLGHVGLDSLQALANQGVLKDTLTYNLEFGKQCVLYQKMKVKFGTATHRSEGLFDCVHVDV